MWYTLYNSQAKVFRAIGEQWKAASSLWDNAYAKMALPITARRAGALAESMHRMFKEYPKPEFGIQSIFLDESTAVGVEQETVVDLPFARLLRFRKTGTTPTKHMSDCFIVAPLSGHYATLLRDTVKGMLVHSDNVFITDWKNVRDVPLSEGLFHLATYVHTIEQFMDHIGHRVHVMAVCQPVVPVLMSASRRHAHPMRPLSMTLIGGPIDARKSPTLVNNYATEHDLNWFKQRVIDYVPFGYPGAGRRVYPGFLQHFGFVAMNPKRHEKAYQDFYKDLLKGDNSSAQKHRAFYDEYNAVLDLDAAYYIETIEEVFQKFTLAKGEMVMEGQPIVPSRIHDIALLTIEGEKDDIAGIGQTRAAQDLCTGLPEKLKRHWEVPEVGHYGVFSGSTFRRKVAPEIAAWQRSITPGASGKSVADAVRSLPRPEAAWPGLEIDAESGEAEAFNFPHGARIVRARAVENFAETDPRPASPEPENAAFWTDGPKRPVFDAASQALIEALPLAPTLKAAFADDGRVDEHFVFISVKNEEGGTPVPEAEKLIKFMGGKVIRSIAGNLLVNASDALAKSIHQALVGWKYYPEYKVARPGPVRAILAKKAPKSMSKTLPVKTGKTQTQQAPTRPAVKTRKSVATPAKKAAAKAKSAVKGAKA